ncbi:MAG: hypothetical protein AB1758_25595 [Candidatus Eremiobacterota bacterium]
MKRYLFAAQPVPDSPLICRLRQIARGLDASPRDPLLVDELLAMEEWLWRQVDYYDDTGLPFRDQVGRHFEQAWSGYALFLQAVVELLDYTRDPRPRHLDLGLELAEQGEGVLRDLERQVQEERVWFDRVTPRAVA